jgi:undecaprenyl diphosphate synthase
VKTPEKEGAVGAERVREIVDACLDRGIEYLTMYAFSKENWKRSKEEVGAIMGLADVFFRRFFRDLRDRGVHFIHLGDREGLPPSVIRIIGEMERDNAETGKLNLCIAFNYSGRSEIVRAVRRLGECVQRGEMSVDEIDEGTIGRHLDTAGIPDPDLLIRTGGEMRISNFLIWQIAYTEIWVTDVLWPDFGREHFARALDSFARRQRRFGAA